MTASKIDPVIKARWVAALRSGSYKQGRGTLYNATDDRFCCLGVLCDLAMEDGLELTTGTDHLFLSDDTSLPASEKKILTYDGQGDFPPRRVAQWVGIEMDQGAGYNPMVIIGVDDDGYEINQPLAELNDNGASFESIADLIEEQL